MSSPDPTSRPAASIASIILGPPPPRRRTGLLWAMVATASLHGVAGVLAYQAWRKGESPVPKVAQKKQTVQIDHVVDLKPPPL
ncbi:ferric siderophore ABC transporter substrate-binding protein, partial [Myxococcus sp. AM011]|nr:ferric siderophore ABC transporter substrate-binding protein [Myxococcus sp. AM011]